MIWHMWHAKWRGKWHGGWRGKLQSAHLAWAFFNFELQSAQLAQMFFWPNYKLDFFVIIAQKFKPIVS
jgi:hypothetical protein